MVFTFRDEQPSRPNLFLSLGQKSPMVRSGTPWAYRHLTICCHLDAKMGNLPDGGPQENLADDAYPITRTPSPPQQMPKTRFPL